MNTPIETCMQQIEALTEIVATLKDDCFELNETNLQLLRQSAATNTKLALVQRALEQQYAIRINDAFITANNDTTDLETIKHVSICEPTQRIPHCSRSLDGNTPIRKLRDDLGAELKSKRK
jgi:nicotinic acid mononucleotide adenylyltransferase